MEDLERRINEFDKHITKLKKEISNCNRVLETPYMNLDEHVRKRLGNNEREAAIKLSTLQSKMKNKLAAMERAKKTLEEERQELQVERFRCLDFNINGQSGSSYSNNYAGSSYNYGGSSYANSYAGSSYSYNYGSYYTPNSIEYYSSNYSHRDSYNYGGQRLNSWKFQNYKPGKKGKQFTVHDKIISSLIGKGAKQTWMPKVDHFIIRKSELETMEMAIEEFKTVLCCHPSGYGKTLFGNQILYALHENTGKFDDVYYLYVQIGKGMNGPGDFANILFKSLVELFGGKCEGHVFTQIVKLKAYLSKLGGKFLIHVDNFAEHIENYEEFKTLFQPAISALEGTAAFLFTGKGESLVSFQMQSNAFELLSLHLFSPEDVLHLLKEFGVAIKTMTEEEAAENICESLNGHPSSIVSYLSQITSFNNRSMIDSSSLRPTFIEIQKFVTSKENLFAVLGDRSFTCLTPYSTILINGETLDTIFVLSMMGFTWEKEESMLKVSQSFENWNMVGDSLKASF
jgi:hypothetical protein